MRKLLLPFLFFLCACSGKQENKKVEKNENTDYLVTLDGIGPVKTGMSQAELEKLLQQKVPLTNPTDSVSGSWVDSAVIKYKGAEIKLDFVRSYAYAAKDSFYMQILGMSTSSPLCKTADNIGAGSGKQQIIDAFENYMLFLEPGYDNDTDTLRSKTLYSIKIREGREGPQIIFYLKNNKVYSIEVGSFYDDAE
jgi:hypothetical protein